MEEQLMTIRSELKEFEKLLNQDFCMEQEGYTFKILNNKVKNEANEVIDVITMQVFADKELLYTYSTTQVFGTLEENIKSLIGSIYAEDINFRKRIISNYKGAFLSRKIKSLSKAITKENADKVNEINMEIVEKYKQAEKCKNELVEFKSFVSLLYRTKDCLNLKYEN